MRVPLFTLFKYKWYALQLPTHLYHFTSHTVAKVLESGGWKVEKIIHQRILSNLVASFGYVLNDKGCKKLGQKLLDFPKKTVGGTFFYILLLGC